MTQIERFIQYMYRGAIISFLLCREAGVTHGLSQSSDAASPPTFLYVFGGRLDDLDRARVYSNDLWRFNLNTKIWEKVKSSPPNGKEIAPRHNCSLTVRPHSFSP